MNFPHLRCTRDDQDPLGDLDQHYPPKNVDYGSENPEHDEDDHDHSKGPVFGPKPHWDRDDYDVWTSVRIKLDALHAMMQFEQTIR